MDCILFSYLNLTLTGLSTAQGDSRTPLLANFIGLAGNMILDPLLILGIGPFPRLEVAGAAIATVSSQILVFVVMVLRIRHSRLEPNVLQHLNLLSVFPKEYYKHIFRIGFPTAIQGSIYCFISMVLTVWFPVMVLPLLQRSVLADRLNPYPGILLMVLLQH